MRYDRIILVLLAALLLATHFYRSRPSRLDPAPAASVVSAGAAGYVRIAGAVKHPGMYALSANIMADNVIKMAEPVAAVAESDFAQFALMPVITGEAINLHIQPDGKVSLTRGSISVPERLVMGIPLDINTISEEDLDLVPGIGPIMAKRIVVFRQNNGGIMSRQDLMSVEGVGEKKYSALSRFFK